MRHIRINQFIPMMYKYSASYSIYQNITCLDRYISEYTSITWYMLVYNHRIYQNILVYPRIYTYIQGCTSIYYKVIVYAIS